MARASPASAPLMVLAWWLSMLLVCATDGGDRNARVFNVRAFGARGDGVTNDTLAISAAVAACRRGNGGDIVFSAPGVYVTSALDVGCNHSRLLVEAGAVVRSVNTTLGWPLGADCPEPAQGKTSAQAAPFLLLHGVVNMTLTGGGVLDARGSMFWDQHCGNWWCPPWARCNSSQPYAWRPFMLRIAQSAQVSVRNLTFVDPAFWCIVPTHSVDISISNTTIVAVCKGLKASSATRGRLAFMQVCR